MAFIESWTVQPKVFTQLYKCIQTVLSVFKMSPSLSASTLDIVALTQTSTSLGGECHGSSSDCLVAGHITIFVHMLASTIYVQHILGEWVLYVKTFFSCLSHNSAWIYPHSLNHNSTSVAIHEFFSIQINCYFVESILFVNWKLRITWW